VQSTKRGNVHLLGLTARDSEVVGEPEQAAIANHVNDFPSVQKILTSRVLLSWSRASL
jgi:hypothetical protein